MFMFSRKLVFLIIVMMLVFGGCSVKGLQCWECSGKDNVCDADHNGGTCDGETCLLQQVRDKQDYRKFCRGDVSDFIGCRQEGHSSRPYKVCYCNTDLCNKDKDFGSGSAGSTSGSVYTISILCWLGMILIYPN